MKKKPWFLKKRQFRDKFDRIANLSVQCPAQHIIPDLTCDSEDKMYWGITYTKQLHAWLRSLTWESQPDQTHPDVSYLELYVNFK